jgi:hypothetical protein
MALWEVVNAAIYHNKRGCALYRRGEKLRSRAAFQEASSILLRVGTNAILEDRLLSAMDNDQGLEEHTSGFIHHEEEAILRNARKAMTEDAATLWHDMDATDDMVTDSLVVHVPVATSSGGLLANDAIVLPQLDECCTNRQCFNLQCSSNNTHQGRPYVPLIIMTAAIVMNVALTFLDECEVDLAHALALFESSYDLSIKEPVTSDLSERVALISLNNATKLQSELGDINRTKQYADTLIRLIHSLPFSFDEARREFRSHFMLNAIVMKGPTVARAA